LAILLESLVNSSHGCQYLPRFIDEYQLMKENRVYSDTILSSSQIEECMKLVNAPPLQDAFTLRKVDGPMMILCRERPTNCPLCCREHEHEHPYLFIVGHYVYWCCRRSINPPPFDRILLGAITKGQESPVANSEEYPSFQGRGVIITGGKAEEEKIKNIVTLNKNEVEPSPPHSVSLQSPITVCGETTKLLESKKDPIEKNEIIVIKFPPNVRKIVECGNISIEMGKKEAMRDVLRISMKDSSSEGTTKLLERPKDVRKDKIKEILHNAMRGS